jgi:photoactive yellow protein
MSSEFNDPGLNDWLEAASAEELDGLAFGAIGMTADGTVTLYNKAEAAGAGLTQARVIGRHFFGSIAPCTNNYLIAQRFETEAEIYVTIDYVFTLRMKPTPVRLRLLKVAGARRMYLLVDRRPSDLHSSEAGHLEILTDFFHTVPVGLMRFQLDGSVELSTPLVARLPDRDLSNAYRALGPLCADLERRLLEFPAASGIVLDHERCPVTAGDHGMVLSLTIHRIHGCSQIAVIEDVTATAEQERRLKRTRADRIAASPRCANRSGHPRPSGTPPG